MLMQIPELDTVQLFATALAIGALLGVERERKRLEDGQAAFAGIRSFVLISEAGALAMWLTLQAATPLIFVSALLGLCVLVTAAHVLERRDPQERRGVTTELAAITVFLLGGMVMAGQGALAVALAVANVALLALKAPLHGLVRKLDQEDLLAGLKLMIASFIVLPLLPDSPIGPWQALNPYKLWLLVVLISALSLVGYVAMRWLGSARGVAVTGLAGGLVSSTAVSLSMARESRSASLASSAMDDAYAAGILIAWSVMFLRVAGMLLLLNPSVLRAAGLPLGAMFVAGALAAVIFYRRSLGMPTSPAAASVPLSNPFSLWSACKFAALFAVVLLLVAFTRHNFADSGVVYIALLAGATDVDAITLSMADFGKDPARLALAASAIVASTLSNTVTKAAMSVMLGSRGLAWRVGGVTSLMLIVGGAGLWLA